MLREGAALQAANGSASGPTAFRASAVVSWRALVAAAVLSLVLGAALFQGVAGERSSVVPAVRSGGFSHKGLLSLPLAAQGPVSAALGAPGAAYQIVASDGGFAAASSAQRLSVRFGRSGVSVSSGATRVGLSLQAVGYGTSLRALGEVAPRVKANRVVYARAGLSEWYVNGPLGLEQGFTIPRAPTRHPAGPLTLSMALSGNTRPSLGSGGQSITLSRAGGLSLRYSGLSATDARGRVLHSWLALYAGRVLLRVDTRGAHYPLRIDPFVQQGERLTGSGESGNGFFGGSVALSSDGNTALIGGPYDNNESGAAWVFTRSGSTWTQQGEKLTGGGESGNGGFGGSVALSSDGNTALIGGAGDNSSVGAAWVFTRSGSTWTQQGEKLTGSGEIVPYGGFGDSVALSSDGNTALIGGPYYDNNEGQCCAGAGAAWVFVNNSPTVVTGAASSVTQSSANLNATVNPNGETVSDCHFEYGTSMSYGSSVPCTSLPGSGESPVAVSAPLESLSEGTTYHFRIVATNPSGSSYGTDQAFSTLANPPEYGRCVKVPAEKEGRKTVYHGGFTATTCLAKNETRTGRYEWYPGAAKTHFTIKLASGSATFETVKGAKVTCTNETSTGEYTGHKTVGGVVLALTGCERASEKCSNGIVAGEIVSNPLEGVLGVEKLGANSGKNKIGLDLHPVGKTGPLMEFSCGSTTVSIQGSVIVPISANKMSLTQTLKFKASKGKQKPQSFVKEPKDILEASLNGGPFEQIGLTLTTTQTNEEEVEVNSVY